MVETCVACQLSQIVGRPTVRILQPVEKGTAVCILLSYPLSWTQHAGSKSFLSLYWDLLCEVVLSAGRGRESALFLR